MSENKKFYCIAYFKNGSQRTFTRFPNVASVRVFLDEEKPGWAYLELFSRQTGRLLNTYYAHQSHCPDWGIIQTTGIE